MNPQIDFYILPKKSEQNYFKSNSLSVACALTEKAFLLSQTVYLLCENQSVVNQMDRLLWTFKQNAFIPHHIDDGLKGENSDKNISLDELVLISDYLPNQPFDLLINLSKQSIDLKAIETKRIIEIIEFETKSNGRDKYKNYLSLNQKPITHEIS